MTTDLEIALAESVKLQSHYAELLNMHDGGKRRIFKTSAEWIERLKEMGTITRKTTKPEPPAPTRGWGFPLNARKAHYFFNGRSLCGRFGFFGVLEEGNDNSPDNCKACKTRLLKMRGET